MLSPAPGPEHYGKLASCLGAGPEQDGDGVLLGGLARQAGKQTRPDQTRPDRGREGERERRREGERARGRKGGRMGRDREGDGEGEGQSECQNVSECVR